MLELKAGAFVDAANSLASMASYVSARSSSESIGEEKPFFHEDSRLEQPDRNFVRRRLDLLAEHLTVLGADVTEVSVADALKSIDTAWANWGTVRDEFSGIQKILRRELSLKTVLVLQAQDIYYYAPKKPLFGGDFADKFKTMGAFELDEAAKCFALGRPTACVFHLMRIMEIGIRALANSLQIPDPAKPAEKNWGL